MADPWHAVLIITSGAQTSIPATHRADTLDIVDIYTLYIHTLDIYTPWISTLTSDKELLSMLIVVSGAAVKQEDVRQ